MAKRQVGWLLPALAVAALVGGYLLWQASRGPDVPEGLAMGNGRIEAVEIDVAAKTAGRIVEILVREGDLVRKGDTLARIDTKLLKATLRQTEAEAQQARITVETAKLLVEQRQAEKRSAQAQLEQSRAALEVADKQFKRAQALIATSAVSEQTLDSARGDALQTKAAVSAAEAALSAAEAAIKSAEAEAIRVQAAVVAADAAVDSIKTQIEESELIAPRDGRVQYLVAREGEIVAAGGRVINMVDLGDVYMSFFLPTAEAGRIGIGTPARIVLDAAPGVVIPATVSYVADVAQFTPKTVETEVERQKLMFRVRAQIDKALLQRHSGHVKTGLPGVAYVQVSPDATWPAELEHTLVK